MSYSTCGLLKGKKGVIIGIANNKSIAYGCAKMTRALGAELAITYRNEKTKPHVEGIMQELSSILFMPFEVDKPEEINAFFDAVHQNWGTIDFIIHSVAFCPAQDLHGRVVDVSRDGFNVAMDTSCYSFIQVARHAESLMPNGGSIMTLTYLGSDRVVSNYNIMGPVKAALESVTRYMAAELGPKKIRVNAISPGPIKTRAASGISEFDKLLEESGDKSPIKSLLNIEDVGGVASFLASDLSLQVTGEVIFVDGGANFRF